MHLKQILISNTEVKPQVTFQIQEETSARIDASPFHHLPHISQHSIKCH